MPFFKKWLATLLLYLSSLAGHPQSSGQSTPVHADWRWIQFDNISFRYPPGWWARKDTMERHIRVVATTDSMKNLHWQLMELYELPYGEGRTFDRYSGRFATTIREKYPDTVSILKTEEISFQTRRAMYAEIIVSRLPVKVYEIDGGNAAYIFFFVQRRWSRVPDPRIEGDEKAILNSITFGR